ncbi:MAG: hypothetical protein ACI9BW_003187 [Gammaproteobacteria bacterium]|jgi:hypothetical protein
MFLHVRSSVTQILLGLLLMAGLVVVESCITGEEIREGQRIASTAATRNELHSSLRHSRSLVTVLASAGDAALRDTMRQELRRETNQLRHIHQLLLRDSTDLSSRDASDKLRAIYIEAPYFIDRQMQAYFSAVEQWLIHRDLRSSPRSAEPPISAATYVHLQAALDAAINQAELDSEDHVAKIRLRDASFLGF